jgi:hypothetical protein
MPLREQEIDHIINFVAARPYWGGGSTVFNALGLGENLNVRPQSVFRERLLQLDEERSQALLSYFELRDHYHNAGLWPIKGLKLFISHRDDQRACLALLAVELQRYGIAAFLAHDRIVPGQDWQKELLRGLSTMDALLAYCSHGFAYSDWTAQEVGFALGKKVPIVSVEAGETPRGFLAQRQGIRKVVSSGETARMVAANVFDLLAAEEAAKEPLSEGLASQLKFADSFVTAGLITERLLRVGRLSPGAIDAIRIAQAANNQVGYNDELLALMGWGAF